MKLPYYLERADMNLTPSDLARLDNPKLGDFKSLKPQRVFKGEYNPRKFNPDQQSPKFFLYTVQRREVFEEEEEEDLAKKVESGEIECEERDPLDYGSAGHTSSEEEEVDDENEKKRKERVKEVQKSSKDREKDKDKDKKKDKEKEKEKEKNGKPQTVPEKRPSKSSSKGNLSRRQSSDNRVINGRKYSPTVRILLTAESTESIDPMISREYIKRSDFHDDTTTSARNNEYKAFQTEEEEEEQEEPLKEDPQNYVNGVGKEPGNEDPNRLKKLPPLDQEMNMGTVSFILKVKRRILQEARFFNPGNTGTCLQYIHLRVPRVESMQAFVTAIEFLAGDKKYLTEYDNVYELLALSHFLGISELQRLCAKRITKEIDLRRVVLAGHLGSIFKNEKVLRGCYQWICSNLVRKDLLSVFEEEFNTFDEIRDLDLSPRRLHFLADNALAYDCFAVNTRIFHELFVILVKEKAVYYCPPKDTEPHEFVLIRTREEGKEPVYRMYDKVSGEFVIAAVYSPNFNEYIISLSKSTKNIQLYNDTYLGGIRCNLTGTLFTIFDYGCPNAAQSHGYAPYQTELALVSYGRNLFGWEPREFSIALPKNLNYPVNANSLTPSANSVDTQGARDVNGWGTVKQDYLMAAFERQEKDKFIKVSNVPPKWNEERNTYTLDFRKKVRKASKKNFILQTETENQEVMMMGKLEVDAFHIHYLTPFSLVTTFGIALSSFHKKILVK